jgi:dTDP-4-amino-4,6-dideoxygalactose transaminase
LYRHPYFARRSGDLADYFPETEAYYAQALSLPLYDELTSGQVERVVKALREVIY